MVTTTNTRQGSRNVGNPTKIYLQLKTQEFSFDNVNSLAPGGCGCNLKLIIFELIWRIYVLSNSCESTISLQGWVSSGRNLFLPGHPEKSGRNLFLPVLCGQNWKKLDKTGKNYERGQKCWKKVITILNYLQKIIMIMVTIAFG